MIVILMISLITHVLRINLKYAEKSVAIEVGQGLGLLIFANAHLRKKSWTVHGFSPDKFESEFEPLS